MVTWNLSIFCKEGLFAVRSKVKPGEGGFDIDYKETAEHCVAGEI